MELETTRGRFDVIDEGKGTPLVLVHGFPFDAEMWRADVKALSTRMRVIAPSMRGFGATPGSAKELKALTIESMADDVAAIVATLDLPGTFVIGGLSMGGYIAMAFARKYGEVLRGLVLADTRAEADSDENKAKRDESIAKANAGDVSFLVNDVVASFLSPTTHAERPAIVEDVRTLVKGAKPAVVASVLRALRDREDATAYLEDISVPVLVIVGEDDAVTPRSDAKHLLAAMPQTRTQLTVIPHAGHLSNIEQPEAFCKAITDFTATL